MIHLVEQVPEGLGTELEPLRLATQEHGKVILYDHDRLFEESIDQLGGETVVTCGHPVEEGVDDGGQDNRGSVVSESDNAAPFIHQLAVQ